MAVSASQETVKRLPNACQIPRVFEAILAVAAIAMLGLVAVMALKLVGRPWGWPSGACSRLHLPNLLP